MMPARARAESPRPRQQQQQQQQQQKAQDRRKQKRGRRGGNKVAVDPGNASTARQAFAVSLGAAPDVSERMLLRLSAKDLELGELTESEEQQDLGQRQSQEMPALPGLVDAPEEANKVQLGPKAALERLMSPTANGATLGVARGDNGGKDPAAEARTYKRKTRRMKRTIDLFTFSPYFRQRRDFAKLRLSCAVYLLVSLCVSLPLWGDASQYTKGNKPCKATPHTVGVFVLHPTFLNMVLACSKLFLGAYLGLRHRTERLRMAYSILEHVAAPGTLTFCLYFWGASKDLDSRLALALAFNNYCAVPAILLAETWLSKTPFLLVRVWETAVLVVVQALLVFAFSLASEGCYLLPALNPDRNVLWVSYPGLAFLYLLGFIMIFTLTQVRDHVAPCGQQVLAPVR